MICYDMYDICKSEVVLNFNTHNEDGQEKEKALNECTPSILQQLRLHTKFMQSERETHKETERGRKKGRGV